MLVGSLQLARKEAHPLAHYICAVGLPMALRWSYRGTSPMRKRLPLGPYSRAMSRALRWSKGVGRFLMGEVSL